MARFTLRISEDSFLYRNSLLVVVPYLLFLILFNMALAWWLLDASGLGWVPPFHLYPDARMFQIDWPGKWIAFPAAGLALCEHILLTLFIETGDHDSSQSE